jgi:AraC family transcriptional regulator of adaptative response / methylphosphotriester-DNA alkyltransferase methyltransferase
MRRGDRRGASHAGPSERNQNREGMQRTTTIRTRATLVREANAVMQADYAAELTLDDVARQIATSRRQLQRCFDEHSDIPFRQCLARIRMHRAAELLTETSIPVREIAARVGYRQPAQFAKAFSRVHGVPPTRYRADRARRFELAA